MLGLDLLNYTPTVGWHDGTPETAIQWCVAVSKYRHKYPVCMFLSLQDRTHHGFFA